MIRRYIEISGKGIIKNAYEVRKELPQVPIPVDELPIECFFDMYNIPEEYRKIFLVIEKRGFKRKIAKEFNTYIPFHLYFTRDKDYNVIVRGALKEAKIGRGIYIREQLKRVKGKDVKNFYNGLKEKELLESYLNAVKAFYGLSLDEYYDINKGESKGVGGR